MLEWLRNAVRRLRSRTQPQEPFDFRSYEFPRLDVDRTANELRLLEQAEGNGSHNIPAAEDTAFDGPQEKVVQFIRGEVARISAGYETALTGLNGRIRDLNVPKHVQHLSELPGEFSHEIESLGRETRHGLGVAREDGGGANPDSKYFFGVKRPN